MSKNSKSQRTRRTTDKRHAKTPLVHVTAWIENVDTDTISVELDFLHENGRRKKCRVLRSELLNTSVVEKRLLDKGAKIPTDRANAKEFLGNLIEAKPATWQRVTRRSGWHGRRQFVLPRRTIGSGRKLAFDIAADEKEHNRRGKDFGSLRGWQKGLRPALAKSSYLTFGLSLSFAAPVAAAAKLQETAVFHVSGESNSGKTLMEKVTVSTLGRAREDDLVSFNVTKVGSQDVMAHWNGTLIAMNEMKTAEVLGNDLRSYIVALTHVLTSGIGRTRADYARRDPDLASKRWNAFGITNMEASLESLARKAKWNRDPGDRARYIDLPVPLPDQGGIFDRIHTAQQKIPERARELAATVEETIARNYGGAFPPFIEYFIEHREAALAEFASNADRFVDKYAPADNWERRFALKFGYACAGGLLAVKAGVLPCTSEQVIKSALRLYRRARGSFQSDLDLKEIALGKLLDSMTDDRLFPFVERNNSVPEDYDRNCYGFRRRYPKIGRCIGIRSEILRRWAVTDQAFDELIRELQAVGAHVRGRDKNGLTQIRKLTGGGRRRYVMLRLAGLRAMRQAVKTPG